MFKYNLAKEFGIDSENSDEFESISVSPYWMVAVIRFAQPLTFSRKRMFTGSNRVSFNDDNTIITQTREMLFIDSDCVSLQINQNKGSYVSSMNAMFVEGNNYLSEILPSDWVMAWIVDSEEKIRDIKKRIKSGKPANKFDDGLKFIGRVQSMRKTINQDASGTKIVRYQLQALGGNEFDSSIFYEPALAEQEVSIGQFLAKMNIGISDICNMASEQAREGKGGIDSNKAIPTLLKLLLGDGVPKRFANPSGETQIGTGLTSTPEAPYAYAVPKEIGDILGKTIPSKTSNSIAFADIFELVIGVQKYNVDSQDSFFGFMPELDVINPDPTTNRRVTKVPLKGEFLPQAIPLVNKPVWSVLAQFLNPAINEMYYTLRVNPSGNIVPTLVVRQLPFSTETAVAKMDQEVTSFLELPRWVVPNFILRSLDIGRSDAAHFNFIHVYGESSAMAGSQTLTKQVIRNPPIRDEQDIKRNGLRSYMQSVNCSINDTFRGPRLWMEIVADFLIGQQFTLNGTALVQGIHSPICVGDNVEVDGVVYHLEGISHTCSVAPSGVKSFLTSLALTHGIRSELAQTEIPEMKTKTQSVPDDTDYTLAINDAINRPSIKKGVSDSPLLFNSSDSYLKEIQVAGDRELNPDLFMYSGITPGDNMALGAGMTILDAIKENEDSDENS